MQEEKNRIERVLGAISAPDLIQKVLNFALSVRMTTFTACCKMLVLFLRLTEEMKEVSFIVQFCFQPARLESCAFGGKSDPVSVFLYLDLQSIYISLLFCSMI